MATNYRKFYFSQPTEKLLGIYQNNRGKYEDEVYLEIEKILAERHVDFEKIDIEENAIEDKGIIENKADYLPMILGIISTIFSFFAVKFFYSIEQNIAVPVAGLIITIRIMFLMYCVSLCNTYKLNNILWFVLVLIFGGWAMIALNIAALFKTNDKSDELEPEDGIDSVLRENSGIAFEKVTTATAYTNCPACLKDLKGQNKCDDCDLEFE